MQSMTDKKKEREAACQAAVNARDFAVAAKAAADVADCAEILASRTTGVIAEAYLKEVESWRALAGKLEARKGRVARGSGKRGMGNGEQGTENGERGTEGDEWLVGEKPNITFDDIAGMEDAKRVIDEMVLYPMKSPEKARALGLNPGGGVLPLHPPGDLLPIHQLPPDEGGEFHRTFIQNLPLSDDHFRHRKGIPPVLHLQRRYHKLGGGGSHIQTHAYKLIHFPSPAARSAAPPRHRGARDWWRSRGQKALPG